MITIRPYSGLANRMRAIDSVISITKNQNSTFRIIWENNIVLNCEFENLFLVPPGVEMISKKTVLPDLAIRIINRIRKSLRKIKIYFPLGYDKYLFEKELKSLSRSNYDFHLLNSDEKVYIESQNRFFENDSPFINFIPIPLIQQKIDSCIKKYHANTIGVHIRRGDNEKSTNESPLAGFITLMKTEIEKDINVLFFLATDSVEIENSLHKQFPDRILSNNKVLDRNSIIGMQDALTDMMCLAKTRKIFGSYWSSFSETAAAIGQIDLIVVRKPDSDNLKL